ncbi:DUF3341 domain-containing protein [bacterium]|nr:DUF3341 domain-containing protein [bacterium]HPF36337.1 DUF3341 domain-containing protein [Candidatus Krumholzibacteria bacterium]HRX51892.1 DUF3341 domain-containing protein [Candidatus Krumholzibacteria bacterium]
MSDKNTELYGYLAEFTEPGDLLEAAAKVRDAGFEHWDCHTPFPLHGLDDAMGVKGTKLPLLVLGGGLTGLTLAALMQWWMNAVDYPFWISGKPFFGVPAAVPVMFELTVLFSALTTFFGMWILNGLPRHHHPLFSSARFKRATADRFFISIEARDRRFHPEKTREFLESLRPDAVEAVED